MKINFRHGIIGYSKSKAQPVITIANSFAVALQNITLTMASKHQNYIFTITEQTSLCEITAIDGAIISHINHSDGSLLHYCYNISTVSEIYNDEPLSPVYGQLWFDAESVQGYIWNGSAWCQRDFIVLAQIKESIVLTMQTATQIANNPSKFVGDFIANEIIKQHNGQPQTSYTKSNEYFYLTENNSYTEWGHNNLNLNSDEIGFISAMTIPKFKPIGINEDGELVISTGANNIECIGLADADYGIGATITSFHSGGYIKNNTWAFIPNKVLYIDNDGNIVDALTLNDVNYLKNIGISIKSNEILFKSEPYIKIL